MLLLCAAPGRSMVINLVPGAGLAGNAQALAAFQRAADAWDAIFIDPIAVTINADLAGGFANPNIIGSTSSVFLQAGYNTIRNQLVTDSAAQADKSAITAALPTAAQFTGFLPTGFALSGNIQATKANLKAMGFGGLDASFGASDATITFNNAFAFSFDPGPVPGGLMDFTSVATHEIGHALGFVSAVDNVDILLGQGSTGVINIDPLDLYRFRDTNLPSTLANFTTTTRSLLPGGTSYFADLISQYKLSTGVATGDGNQASHWKADDITGNFIGIMDPTINFGVRESITAADIRALELIGWDLNAVPEPGTVVLALTGLVGLVIRRRRQA
jgi:hypothetical protein